MIKIALIGYGKMGQVIDNIASSFGAEIVARIDPNTQKAEWDDITGEALANADVYIDFSHPDAVLDTIKKLGPFHKPLVIGTTGWYDQMEEVAALVEKYDLGVIYAQNFSLGMDLFVRIVEEAASLISNIGNYDVALSEIHHRHKVDSPSGTARVIAEVLLKNTPHKTKINHDLGEDKIEPDELHISSVRVGTVPGTHTVIFNSDQDTITLTHQAHNRSAWAQGALEAAKWIQNKKGLFNMNDMMEALTCNSPE